MLAVAAEAKEVLEEAEEANATEKIGGQKETWVQGGKRPKLAEEANWILAIAVQYTTYVNVESWELESIYCWEMVHCSSHWL